MFDELYQSVCISSVRNVAVAFIGFWMFIFTLMSIVGLPGLKLMSTYRPRPILMCIAVF